jgi:hypothetical protein
MRACQLTLQDRASYTRGQLLLRARPARRGVFVLVWFWWLLGLAIAATHWGGIGLWALG